MLSESSGQANGSRSSDKQTAAAAPRWLVVVVAAVIKQPEVIEASGGDNTEEAAPSAASSAVRLAGCKRRLQLSKALVAKLVASDESDGDTSACAQTAWQQQQRRQRLAGEAAASKEPTTTTTTTSRAEANSSRSKGQQRKRKQQLAIEAATANTSSANIESRISSSRRLGARPPEGGPFTPSAEVGAAGGRRRRRRHGDLNWPHLVGRPGRLAAAAAAALALALALAGCLCLVAPCSAAKRPAAQLGAAEQATSAGGAGQQQVAAANFGGGRLLIKASGRRVLRQISPTSWRSAAESAPQQQQQLPGLAATAAGQPQQSVPYKTFYVTRACEWKSNLFVPKSNDIHFAQLHSAASANSAPLDAEQAHSAPSGPESSVVYETFNTNANNNYQNSRTNGVQSSQPSQPVQLQFQQQQQLQQPQQLDGSRTMLSTDSKALILALPIVMSHSFAGYEPACSIRLIVPRNMRILAKLTSRRLTFAQQQLEAEQSALDGQPQVWLNVSQSEFSETEHRTIETAGNVLAFRFLLERFASQQAPDTRFQVVLTAFQTLAENSDLSGGASGVGGAGAGQTQQQQQPTGAGAGGFPWPSGRPPFQQLDQSAQLICDQQRLISAELACDGFKNCQDGRDEEPATCLALRHPELGGQAPSGNLDPNSIRNQLGADGTLASGGGGAGNEQRAPILVRLWHWARDTNSLAGFLLGLLLVLLLLACCSCCAYLVWFAWRQCWRRCWRNERQAPRREPGEQARELGESDALAAQNAENAARWKRSLAEEERLRQMDRRRQRHSSAAAAAAPGQPAARLQSILKKPGQRPADPPPAVPVRPTRAHQEQQQRAATPSGKRGALASSLTGQPLPAPSSGSGADAFRPTPAKRLTRPTRPVPVPPAAAAAAGSGVSERQLGEQRSTAVSRTMTTTSSTTGTQRVTSYHYSSGSTRYSESYLRRLASEQQQQQQQQQQRSTPSPVAVTGVRPITPGAPPSGANVHYSKREPSPKSSLI